jgi:hypothetical protein
VLPVDKLMGLLASASLQVVHASSAALGGAHQLLLADHAAHQGPEFTVGVTAVRLSYKVLAASIS